MKIDTNTIILYFILINVVAIIVTIYDKKMAKIHFTRVPERNLFIISILGGSLGMYLAMHLVRHKTKKLKFMLGIPIIFLVELLALLYFLN